MTVAKMEQEYIATEILEREEALDDADLMAVTGGVLNNSLNNSLNNNNVQVGLASVQGQNLLNDLDEINVLPSLDAIIL